MLARDKLGARTRMGKTSNNRPGGGERSRFIFDTSGLNRLLDDPKHETVVDFLTSDGRIVYITGINIIEIISCRDEGRRRWLLELCSTLLRGCRPLGFPSELLRRSYRAYRNGQAAGNISLGPEQDGVIIGLKNPDRLDQRAVAELKRWVAKEEKWFHALTKGNRNAVQEALKALPPYARKVILRNSAEFMRQFWKVPDDFLEKLVRHSAGLLARCVQANVCGCRDNCSSGNL